SACAYATQAADRKCVALASVRSLPTTVATWAPLSVTLRPPRPISAFVRTNNRAPRPHPVLLDRTLDGNNVYDIFVGNAALQGGRKAKLGIARGRHRQASRISLHFVRCLDRILSSQPSERRRQSAQGAARNF